MNLNRGVVYTIFGIIVAIMLWLGFGGSDSPTKPVTVVKTTTKTIVELQEFDKSDYDAKFEKPQAKMKNVFAPLLTSDAVPIATALETNGPPETIPGDFTSGEPDWTFNGFATVNGETMALLDNKAKHLSAFVKSGQAWKTGRMQNITSESITLSGPKGQKVTVLRYDPDRPKKAAGAAIVAAGAAKVGGSGLEPMPVLPMLQGPINPADIQVRPIRRRGSPQGSIITTTVIGG